MKHFINLVGELLHIKKDGEHQTASELEIRRAIAELKAMNDRELSDLGLARSEIETAVRYGRKGTELDDPRQAA